MTRRRQHEQRRHARCCRSAVVEDHITHERNASEPGRSHVRPSADDAGGPHREGEEPKPMMHERGKSDSAIVAVKPMNNAERSVAESVEPRAEAKENASQQSTGRSQNRETVAQALERIRRTARQRKKERFTALLHHVSIEHLGEAFVRTQAERGTRRGRADMAGLRGRPRAQSRGSARAGPSGSVPAAASPGGSTYPSRMGGSDRSRSRRSRTRSSRGRRPQC